jgi:hypothetical protein
MTYPALVDPVNRQPAHLKHFLSNLISKVDLIQVPFTSDSETLLPVTILFGTPSKNCTGHGICAVTVHNRPFATVRGCCPQVSAFFLRLSDTGFALLAPKLKFPESVAGRQFSRQFFEMEEDFPLPEFVRRYFKLPANANIPAGQHLIKHDEHFYTVYFDIDE